MKNKLILQILSCLIIAVLLFCGEKTNHPVASQCYQSVKNTIMTQLTMDDVSRVWSETFSFVTGATTRIASTVMEVTEESKYGIPIDEKSDETVKQVHAVAGGMVEKTGKNDAYGLYIQIRHEDAVSVYGNLASVGVIEDERVQRGEIIGSFDSLGGTEFYYELRTNL